MAMNPSIKAKWVAALRSGEYEQCAGTLRNDSGMCCLGVLCDVVNPEGWKKHGNRWQFGGGWGASAILPFDVMKTAGLELEHGALVTIGGIAAVLPNHNDGQLNGDPMERATFAQIADAIEAQL